MDFYGNAQSANLKKSIRVDSIFYNAKLSIYEILLIMFLFVQKTLSKVIIHLLGIDDKTVTD